MMTLPEYRLKSGCGKNDLRMTHAVILNQSQIDQVRWTDLINTCNGSIYNTYEYLSSCGELWEALVVISDSKYVCATPIQFRIKYGIKYIYQSPFVPFYEILNGGGKEIHESFTGDLKSHLSAHQYVAKYFLRDDGIRTINKFIIVEEKGYHLSLNENYQDILKSYSKDRKMRLKQANKNNQVIIKSKDLELFLNLLEEYTLPKIHHIDKWQHKDFFYNLAKWFHLEILISNQYNKVLGGAILIKHRSTIYYLASFSSHEGRKLNSMTLLLDYVIQQNALGHHKFLDLGLKGTEGIEDFKRSFGAQGYRIYQAYKNSLPWYIKIPKAILNSLGIATAK